MNLNELKNLWDKTLNQYKLINNNQLFITEVLEPIKVIGQDENTIYLLVGDKNHIELLANTSEEITKIWNSFSKTNHNLIFTDNKSIINQYLEKPINIEKKWDSTITFENYIIGDFNKNAYLLIEQVIKNGESKFNPIFIYSKTGLGKTHLLIATINELLLKYPDKKIFYIDAQSFIAEVFKYFQDKTHHLLEEFKKFYSSLDVLVIDDIQYLSDKNKTNEVLFQIFNNLISEKKTIILTSDKIPSELNGFEDRMISRFSSGITCKINLPDNESIKQIIKNNLKNKITISNEGINLLTNFYNTDIRKLIGILNKIVFFYSTNEKNNLEQGEIKNILEMENKIIGENKKPIIANPSFIIEVVAKTFNVKLLDLSNNTRKKNITTARHVAMYIMREHAKLQLKDIGNFLGKRDHTTVLNGIEKIKSIILQDKDFANMVDTIIKKIS